MAYLFDASSVYKVVKAGKTEQLILSSTCNLARHETGNMLLKERRIRKTLNEPEHRYLLTAITRALNTMQCIGIAGMEREITDAALKLDMSFYDASYACIARRLGMVLVTEDDKLAKKARGYIKTITADELM